MNNTEQTLKKAARYLDQQCFVEAEGLYREVLTQNPAHISALNGMGALAMRQKRYDTALAFFHETHKQLPANVEVIANMGTALYHLGQPEKAAICYRQALTLDPSHAGALDGLGLAAMQQKNYAAAEQYFQQALKCNPDYWLAWAHLGDLRRDTGHLSQAIEYYEKVIALHPEKFEIMVNLGTAHNNRGNSTEALRWYRKALSVQPRHLVAAYNYIGVLFALRYFDQILEYVSAVEDQQMFTPQERSGLHVHACLVHYLRDTAAQASWHFERADYIKAAPETFPNARILKIYYSYLLKLLEYRRRNPSLYQENALKTLHILGESHCLSPACITVKGWRCKAYLTSGVKAWHLAQDSHNRYKEMVTLALNDIPNNGAALFCYGEIDCRRDEGIYTHYKIHPEINVGNAVADIAKKYVSFVVEQAKKKSLTLLFCGIPAIAKNVSDMEPRDREALSCIISYFNACIAKEAETHQATFVDVYRLTVTSSGFADGSQHIDSYHLYPHVVAEALEKVL